MKEKSRKDKKKSKKHKREKETENKHKKRSISSSSSNSESDEWVEQQATSQAAAQRDNWMSMTGMLKTYTKDDIKSKHEEKEKKHIDSYNPATNSRELNPYWKDGGSGLPQSSEQFKKSRPFIKPDEDDDDDYYRSSSSRDYKGSMHDRVEERDRKSFDKPKGDCDDYYKTSTSRDSDRVHNKYDKETQRHKDSYRYQKTSGWKKQADVERTQKYEDDRKQRIREDSSRYCDEKTSSRLSEHSKPPEVQPSVKTEKSKNSKFLSDEKMNKLAAKLVKAEIMGDTKQVEELKAKLEAAREYRKQNPDAEEEEDEGIMLMSTNSAGNTRPLTKSSDGDPRSKGGKRKAETHDSRQRNKYFANDDKYDLQQMFQQEKYGNNYDDEAQLAKIASKAKDPNDDLEDIFVDEISKNRNVAKDAETEKQRAINQHRRIEKSLEGCEFCVDSKNMLKHLIITMGSKIYLAVPGKQSLVKGHCIITTIQHSTCVTALDEDVWEEILNFRKALTQFFNYQNQDVVFYETATKLHKFPHMVINCVPLPRDVGDMASIYFKKALLECEAEWSMNKKVVDLKGKNIRKGVPKGLPYFWIDFGMDPGFAHVIEDQQLFPKNFAEEIIGGMLDLGHHLWKNPKREYGDLQRKKVLDFIKDWKPFEEMIKKT